MKDELISTRLQHQEQTATLYGKIDSLERKIRQRNTVLVQKTTRLFYGLGSQYALIEAGNSIEASEFREVMFEFWTEDTEWGTFIWSIRGPNGQYRPTVVAPLTANSRVRQNGNISLPAGDYFFLLEYRGKTVVKIPFSLR